MSSFEGAATVVPNRFLSTVDSDLIHEIVYFLGFAESGKTFTRLSKMCNKKHRESFSTLRTKEEFCGRLVEKEGRMICAVLDVLRYAVYDLGMQSLSPAASKVVKSMNDLQTLRPMGLHEDLARLNVGVYSYWDRAAATEGVYPYFLGCVEANPHMNFAPAVERDVKYWRDSRVFGDFYLLFDRQDGAILLSNDFQKVYLVQGLAQTIGSAIPADKQTPQVKSLIPFHGGFRGRKISTTLLNWQDQIVYDGLMMHLGVMTSAQIKKAVKSYCKAVDKHTLITSLKKKLVVAATPLSSSGKAGLAAKASLPLCPSHHPPPSPLSTMRR